MGRVIRRTEIHARRVRRRKLRVLRERYRAATTASAREKIVRKVGLIAPWMAGEKFIAITKK